MTDDTYTIIVGSALDREMSALREGFRRSFPVRHDAPFTQLVEAIDRADDHMRIMATPARR